jgi:flavorubredoxin
MQTTIDEINDGIFRIATWVEGVAPPAGFTFNQFVVLGDEPLLFHTGMRGLFPLVSDAVAKIVPLERLRWIGFGHVEADECGSMNEWLAAAPDAQIAHGGLGVMVSIDDMADRPARPLADGEVIDLGGKRVRHIDTPHVPHAWEARVLYEETTGTLLCGDLFSHIGRTPALTSDDIIEPAMEAEAIFRSSSLAPQTVVTLQTLAALEPTTLAVMHGASYTGDGGAALRALANEYDKRYFAAQTELPA